MNFSAVILAGGKSQRMGRDKAWIEHDGKPLVVRQLDILHPLNPSCIYISCKDQDGFHGLGCILLTDNYPGCGPLAGIEKALSAVPDESLLLVLAVDMPFVVTDLFLNLLAQCTAKTGVVPVVNDRWEPLAAIYPKASRQLAGSLLAAEQNSASFYAQRCFEEGMVVKHVMGDAYKHYFANWNMPNDMNIK